MAEPRRSDLVGKDFEVLRRREDEQLATGDMIRKWLAMVEDITKCSEWDNGHTNKPKKKK